MVETMNTTFLLLTEFEMENSHEIKGNLILDGPFSNSAERAKLEIRAFGAAPAAVPEPSIFILLGVGLAAVRRRRHTK